MRGHEAVTVNPLTVAKRLFVVLMSRERAEARGQRNGLEEEEREDEGRNRRMTKGDIRAYPLFELCQARYIFRFARRVQNDCSTLEARTRENLVL